MKYKPLFGILTSLSILAFSCVFPTSHLSLKVNGKRWQSFLTYGQLTSKSILISGDGGNTGGHCLILLPRGIRPGNYRFGQDTLGIVLTHTDRKGKFYSPGLGGSLLISKHDTVKHLIRGEFAFSSLLEPHDSVSKGIFYVKYFDE